MYVKVIAMPQTGSPEGLGKEGKEVGTGVGLDPVAEFVDYFRHLTENHSYSICK